MRLLLDQRSYDEMLSKPSHPRDCYVRGAEFLHHLYADGVKYLVVRAVYDCIRPPNSQRILPVLISTTCSLLWWTASESGP